MNLELYNLMNTAFEYGNCKIENNPGKTIVWDYRNCLFIKNNCSLQEIEDWIKGHHKIFSKIGSIKIFIENSIVQKNIECSFSKYDIKKYGRIILQNNQKRKIEYDKKKNFVFSEIFQKIEAYENNDELIEEICGTWETVEKFIENGFGIINIDNHVIRGWCLSEYNSSSKCGIGIETIEEFQKKGIGFEMTEAFLSLCYEKDIIPYWDSWDWNIPSIKTAEKSRFDELQKYMAYLVKLNN